MTAFKKIKSRLEGRKLRGFKQLSNKELPYDSDRGIALWLDREDIPVILYTPNQDYSRYDYWEIYDGEPIPLDLGDSYKSIGEKIITVENVGLDLNTDAWYDDSIDYIQFTIRTSTKIMRFGHHWNDCHYPISIWEFE